MEMLINGEHVSDMDTSDVINPYTGEVIDTVPISHLNNVDNAIEAANNAKASLQEMSAFKISNKLFNVVEKLKENREDFALLLTKEIGKPISESYVELDRSIETLKLAAEEAKRIYGESVPLDAGLNGKGFFAFTQKLPLGVVAAITPFNYPLNLTIHKIAPAIAAKNTVIIKPPTDAPLTVMKFAELVNEEFPAGVINTITGYGSEVGDALVASEKIDKITFTGSVTTGLVISQRAGMKKVTLELGGNDPLIVLDDADVDAAVKGVINGAYLNAGQVCMGVKRIIVQEGIYEEFKNKLVEETSKIKMGDPMDKTTQLGTLISEKAAKQVEETVNNAVKGGAEILIGGKRDNAFYEATVIDNVTPEMDLVVNETFGPVAPLIKVKTVEEAIQIANATEYGLQSGVFTQNYRNALRCANEIESGTVFINKQSTFRTDNMPFGGFKNSGCGKEGIKYAVEEMTRTKLIGLNLRS
ncbi:lactaldehyde dehydrogenase [Methanobrevibacter millerae]|uniref:Lactaldehyde dehydrogenase n=1 Tax=Methanobrevibacter millerae TaxID=230361 RepID=A0A1G5VXS9_9EURY|nr:lactaldehyde dehydrogenase [Methanobrevibacter millerae]SDA50700.1 lactaldehyde dehydrogenase [Methanobrevibacter millerae]